MEIASPSASLKTAVLKLGSQSAFARLCGVSQTAVWKWLQSAKRLPAEHVLKVERATGISKHLLRPDIYPETEEVIAEAAAVDCNRSAVFQKTASL
ncbi:YdaS antitoxin of YdaST toxin-antitoxin system [Sphingomonas sp. PP-F2F-G114-C0414]|uniref:transcriptional regulator n=1 Tax=Sphingomonas sp. PP-F2F-G114-C0414 TaxID=2135662 RepID=UPI000EF89D39|nr:YdaS family helix-turn-helix protein [Sphingomonas sp. PP-F2F-G114-C0414]RMB26232.1 YdaS antitoxin of YdaST toxin-antitoxin system [Sphingomonas sp. PP-F2F-G114-C0414]